MNDEVESTAENCETEYFGYEIYVGKNSDRNRGGFEWSVCKDKNELEVGLAISVNVAMSEARKFVDSELDRLPIESPKP